MSDSNLRVVLKAARESMDPLREALYQTLIAHNVSRLPYGNRESIRVKDLGSLSASEIFAWCEVVAKLTTPVAVLSEVAELEPSPDPTMGTCPYCKLDFQLTPQGTFYQHYRGRTQYCCPGSGKAPAQEVPSGDSQAETAR